MIMDTPQYEKQGGSPESDYARVSEFLRILSADEWDDPSPQRLCQAFGEYFKASWCVIFSVDPGTDAVELLTRRNVPPDVQVPSQWSQRIVADVIRTGLGVCQDYNEAIHYRGGDEDPGYSILSFPLFVSGLIFGVLIIGRPSDDPFSEDDIEDSIPLSPFAALFLLNLLAMDRIGKSRSRLEKEQHQLRKVNRELSENSARLEKAFTELSEASRAKNEYFENLSHELRTPLTPILASSEALLGKTLGHMTEEQKEMIEVLFLSAKRLELLIEDLLEMVKLESSSLKMEKECLDVRSILEEGILEIAPIARDKKIRIKNELEREIPLVIGDKKRLSQLFVNLLHNAVKFSHEGGAVTVRLGREKEANGFLGISVMDNGVGIPSEVLGRIFDRFYQASNEKGGSGLGLGLAIVKRIIEAHDGELEVKSQEGKGSTFTAYLPLYRE